MSAKITIWLSKNILFYEPLTCFINRPKDNIKNFPIKNMVFPSINIPHSHPLHHNF